MPFRLDQVSSNFSEGSKDLVLEGRIPERGQGNQISVQLKDAYGMVALSIKADLPSMMLEIGNNYVVREITKLSQRAKRAAVWGTGVEIWCRSFAIFSQGNALGRV